jgi:bleomycin hydrolase
MYRLQIISLVLLILILIKSPIFSQSQIALDMKSMSELKESFTPDGSDRALMNAITNSSLKSITLNRDLINRHDDEYTTTVNVKGITNQKSTGRCWMFAALNLLRPKMIEDFDLDKFEFSQAHLFFWDKLEKSNYFLETIIETRNRDIDDRELQAILANPVPDGGWWNYAVDLIEKYGVIPQTYMPETVNSSNSGMINKIINTMARKYAVELRNAQNSKKSVETLRKRKWEMLQEIYRVLFLHFGLPPEKFPWRVKNSAGELESKIYTPRSFYKEVVKGDLADYVTISDYPVFDYNQLYQINFCRSMPDKADMQFINLDIQALKSYTYEMIKAGEAVWFAADAGWQFERENGILASNIYDYESLFNINTKLAKADKIRYKVSIANHGMTLVAVDEQDGKVIKWKVENSWGTEKGNKGYWAMYNDWFDEYVYTVIIHKKHIKPKLLKILDQKPKIIPAWDPLRNCLLN